MKSEYIGLWEKENQWFISQPITKKQLLEMPKKFRLVMRRNYYYKKGTNRPKYVFTFTDAEDVEEVKEIKIKNSMLEEQEEIIEQLVDTLNEVAEKCRGKYLDNDNDNFLYDTYEFIKYRLDEILGE